MDKKPRNCKTGRDYSIHGGVLYFEDATQSRVDSPEFVEMLDDSTVKSIRLVSLSKDWYKTFYVDWDAKINDNINVEMTLRKEIRSGRAHWYAYRRVMGKLHKRYVGTSENVTEHRLLEVAQVLPSK